MEKDFQDIQQLDSEENDHQLGRSEGPGLHQQNLRKDAPFWKGAPPLLPCLQRLCSWPRISLLALGFNVLLLVIVCVIRSQSTQLHMELQDLKDAFSNFSSRTSVVIQTLTSHGDNVSDMVTSLAAKLGQENENLKSDHNSLLLHLKHFPVDLRILTCQTAFLRSNGTECCPINWREHEGSCYWFSHSGATWTEADKYCQLESAHLVIINSQDEETFLQQYTNPFNIWIGLTNVNSSWKWVDGTKYGDGYKNWPIPQTYTWQERDSNKGEDCVEMRSDGFWNDEFCQQVHRWVCETKQNHIPENL